MRLIKEVQADKRQLREVYLAAVAKLDQEIDAIRAHTQELRAAKAKEDQERIEAQLELAKQRAAEAKAKVAERTEALKAEGLPPPPPMTSVGDQLIA